MPTALPSQAAHFARQAAFYRNEFKQSLGQLIGLVTGLLGDRTLTDAEIYFLRDWMATHDAVVYDWPGNIIKAKVDAVVAAGVISEDDREHLIQVLDNIVGCRPETMSAATHVTTIAYDPVQELVFPGRCFCFTGDFVYAHREVCESACAMRGGVVRNAVSKKVDYVVVGSFGSPAWKFGSFGTKLKKAVELRQAGGPILIVKEDVWAAAL